MYWVAGVIYINQMAPDNLKTTSQSLLLAEMSLASVIGAPVSGYLYDWLGGSSLFFFSSGVCLVALSILWFGFLTERKNISLGR
jgi:predicted MFS family arabinose efflux permease